MIITYLILGTNMGDRFQNLGIARSLLQKSAGTITGNSSVYETEPWGFETDTSFLNQVISLETHLSPELLLKKVLEIEKQSGRVRKLGKGFESRIIDIDILLYGDSVINTTNLVVPHPHMQQRMFVLVPLSEVIPDYVHPVLKRTILELKNRCTDTGWIRKMS
jgi:2-amino-4-hydroxy-6-hydroxymethyldihydropteridine diphosphokinase